MRWTTNGYDHVGTVMTETKSFLFGLRWFTHTHTLLWPKVMLTWICNYCVAILLCIYTTTRCTQHPAVAAEQKPERRHRTQENMDFAIWTECIAHRLLLVSSAMTRRDLMCLAFIIMIVVCAHELIVFMAFYFRLLLLLLCNSDFRFSPPKLWDIHNIRSTEYTQIACNSHAWHTWIDRAQPSLYVRTYCMVSQ